MKRLTCFFIAFFPLLTYSQIPMEGEMPDLAGVPIRSAKVKYHFGLTVVWRYNDSQQLMEKKHYPEKRGIYAKHSQTPNPYSVRYSSTTTDGVYIIREAKDHSKETIRHFNFIVEWRHHYDSEKKLVKREHFIETAFNRSRQNVDSNFHYINGQLQSYTSFSFIHDSLTYTKLFSYFPDGRPSSERYYEGRDTSGRFSTRTCLYNNKKQLIEEVRINADNIEEFRYFYEKHDQKGLWQEKYFFSKAGQKITTYRTIQYR